MVRDIICGRGPGQRHTLRLGRSFHRYIFFHLIFSIEHYLNLVFPLTHCIHWRNEIQWTMTYSKHGNTKNIESLFPVHGMNFYLNLAYIICYDNKYCKNISSKISGRSEAFPWKFMKIISRKSEMHDVLILVSWIYTSPFRP